MGEGRGGLGARAERVASPLPELFGLHVGLACAALFFTRLLEPSNRVAIFVMSVDCVTNSSPIST